MYPGPRRGTGSDLQGLLFLPHEMGMMILTLQGGQAPPGCQLKLALTHPELTPKPGGGSDPGTATSQLVTLAKPLGHSVPPALAGTSLTP